MCDNHKELEKHDRSRLIGWEYEDYDYFFDDQLSQYWDKLNYDHWYNIGKEARELYNELFDGVEEDSPLDDFLKCIAIAGFEAALTAISNIQKTTREDLMEKIDEYWCAS